MWHINNIIFTVYFSVFISKKTKSKPSFKEINTVLLTNIMFSLDVSQSIYAIRHRKALSGELLISLMQFVTVKSCNLLLKKTSHWLYGELLLYEAFTAMSAMLLSRQPQRLRNLLGSFTLDINTGRKKECWELCFLRDYFVVSV